MEAEQKAGEEYGMKGLSPQNDRVVERPGGPLVGQPAQGLDGNQYDQFGDQVDVPASYNASQNDPTNKDTEYADRFWVRQPEGMRDIMIGKINTAVEKEGGIFSLFADPAGISEHDKEKMSAYRALAKELGYEIGQYKFNPQTYCVSAPVKKL